MSGRTGGVDVSGDNVQVSGDVVGRDKNVYYTVDAEKVVDALAARGVIKTAADNGLERQTILSLANRLRPGEVMNFPQAVKELERAVTVALDVIARGAGTETDFVGTVLQTVAEQTRAGDLDGGVGTIDDALAKIDAEQRRQKTTLLENSIKMEILRRNEEGVANRVGMLVAVDQPTDRPTWLPAYFDRQDGFCVDGETKGVNFSLVVAVTMAQRMVDTARDATERMDAANALGIALSTLGNREAGTVRAEQAVAVFSDALKACSREHTPLLWAQTQGALGTALSVLGEKKKSPDLLGQAVRAYQAALDIYRPGVTQPGLWGMTLSNLADALSKLGGLEAGSQNLEKAVGAYQAALKVRTRENQPNEWATSQMGLGNTLTTLGARQKSGTVLREAIAAFQAALTVWTPVNRPFQWALTQSNLGNAFGELGACGGSAANLQDALRAYDAAISIYDYAESDHFAQRTRANRAKVLGRLAEISATEAGSS